MRCGRVVFACLVEMAARDPGPLADEADTLCPLQQVVGQRALVAGLA